MGKRKSLKVILELEGEALDFVLDEQKKRKKEVRANTHGKSKLVNLLLVELKNKRAQ